MKNAIFILILTAMSLQVSSQKYITKNGNIRFHSDAPLEKIEAINKQVNSALDITSGDFVFKVVMKSFEFEKALMQEHFNENYVESDKFPTSSFVGKVTNIKTMDFSKEGSFKALVEGKLTLHGVSNNVKTEGTLESKGGKIAGHAVFSLKVKDYNIEIPGAVVKNIAEEVEITVNILLEKL